MGRRVTEAEFGKLSDFAKFALDDARQRQKALLDLIYAIDRQAMTLLGFSVTLSVATGSGAFAVGSKVFIEADHRPIMVSACFALLTMSIGFIVAAAWCLTVMKTRKIGFPGKGAAFWTQAWDEQWPEAWLMTKYLEQVEEADQILLSGSREMAKDLSDARGIAVATFLVGVGVAMLSPTVQALFR